MSFCSIFLRDKITSLKKDIISFNKTIVDVPDSDKYLHFLRTSLPYRRDSIFRDLEDLRSKLGNDYRKLLYYAKKSLLQDYERF